MPRRKSPARKWSGRVTRESRALVLEKGVFTWDDPKRIAASLRRSAEASTTRKTTPYASAMSMLNFFINRAGKSLPQKRRCVLERAKAELREAYHRAAGTAAGDRRIPHGPSSPPPRGSARGFGESGSDASARPV